MLESEDSYRTLDIKRDPRFRGWWPSAHPQMASFLGVPIVARGEVIGAFYLTDKERAEGFSAEDQELIEMLAPHAAVAMENARLYERSRELSIVEERNRLARELHDSLVQKLFGVVLAAQSAGDPARARLRRRPRAGRAPPGAGSGGGRGAALAGLPAAPGGARDRGPAAGAAQARRAAAAAPTAPRSRLELSGTPRLRPGVDEEVFRIAQESLQNALRHSRAEHIELRLDEGAGGLRLTVSDDGVGFEPEDASLRSRRLGLTSMEERARALGARLRIDSAPGRGTTIAPGGGL